MSVIFQFAAAPTLRSDTHLSSAKHQLGSGSGPGVGGRAVGVSAIGCLLCGSEIGVRTLLPIHRGWWIAAIGSQKDFAVISSWEAPVGGGIRDLLPVHNIYIYILYIYIYIYIFIIYMYILCVYIYIYTRYWFIFFLFISPQAFLPCQQQTWLWLFFGEAFEKFAETASSFGAGDVRHHRDTVAEYQRTWWKMEICGHLKHQSVAMLLPPTFTKRKQLETTVMGGNYGFDQWSRQVSSNRIQWYPVPPSSELRRSSSAGFRDGITGFDLVYGAVAAPGKTYGNPFFQGLAPQWRPKIQ